MYRNLTLLISCCLLAWSCTQQATFNEEDEKAKILKLHELQREYHVKKMAKEFVSLLSENHMSVNRGMISTATAEENITRFQQYFDAVEFEKWDDITPPIVKFSDDFSLAYTIVHKDVTVTYLNKDQQKMRETTEFAWLAIYKRYPEGWKIDCVASTNKESVGNQVEKEESTNNLE